MHITKIITLVTALSIWALLAGCNGGGDESTNGGGDTAGDGTHTHDDGTVHSDQADEGGSEGGEDAADEGHEHDEVSIGSVTIGDMQVELAQGHGSVEAGKEGHLVVKLPYNDNGASVVRAWIGTDDRTLSMVGLGEYAASHDDYDVHAVAPDPLPEGAMWWVEIEKPDGTKVVGSAPILEDVGG